ncbi:rab-GTPase-TBC domain-containing protein [Trichophaea hybrida]|nr:rab-GTPase-TBC domain-containing protein [Trichophaea hybrida]
MEDIPAKNEPSLPPIEPRDRYGFKKQTQYISLAEYEEWESRYSETLDRRRKKWDQLLRESGLTPGEGGPVRFPPKSAKIKRYVRKGIPPEWRGAAWFWYAGGQKYLNKYPGKYDELVNQGPLPPDSELIERDLHRTFPDNIKYKPDPPPGMTRLSKLQEKQYETVIVQQLRRVLTAFASYVPKIGYCQSLNFLAGLLLLFMPEEKTFWMLYILTHTHLPGTHELNLEGSSVDQWVLMSSVRDSLPQIWAKIGGGLDGSEVELNSTKLPPVTLCTSSWFMSGFIGSLPIETTLRVWDCLFYEGSKTLFRIALTVFKTGESQIRSVHDPMEIFQVVQTIPRSLIDAGALIEACYRRRNGFGHLSQEAIDEKRQERRNAFAEERALIASGVRLSKDDGALRGNFDNSSSSRGQTNGGHHHDLGRRFRKILVKT